MLEDVDRRRRSLGLSIRGLAGDLGVSPTLVSLVFQRRRKPSADLEARLRRWMATPYATSVPNAPSPVYSRFIAERTAHVASRTIGIYRQKLEPFVRWAEEFGIVDLRRVTRGEVAEFLAHIVIQYSWPSSWCPARMFWVGHTHTD